MTQTKRYSFAALALTVAAVAAGCDQKKAVHTNETPFSLAGITLGMDKEQLRPLLRFESCEQRTKGVASCPLADPSKTYRFFDVGINATVTLHEPYTAADSITFSFAKDNLPDRDLIERTWRLEGRCLDGVELRQIKHQSTDFEIHDSIDRFSGLGGLPSELRDFLCLSTDGHLLLVTTPHYLPYGHGMMITLSARQAVLYERLLVARDQPAVPLPNPMIE